MHKSLRTKGLPPRPGSKGLPVGSRGRRAGNGRGLALLGGAVLVAGFAGVQVTRVVPLASASEEPPGPVVEARTGVAELPLAPLVAAGAIGDRAELARLAGRMGPARLARILAGRDMRAVSAVLDAASLLPDATALLPALGRYVRSSVDRPEAQLNPALALLGRLLAGRGALTVSEIPPDEIAEACRALAMLATSDTASVAVRVASVEALGEASPACPGTVSLMPLLEDVMPEVRRVAAALAPALAGHRASSAPAETQLVRLLADPVPGVATSAAAALCRWQSERPFSAPLPPTLRVFLTTSDTHPEDIVDVLPCLIVSSSPEERSIVHTWAARGASALAERARELERGPR